MTGLRASTTPPPRTPPTPGRTCQVLRTVWRSVVADRVDAGRLRDVGWPYGLSAVVTLGTWLFVVAGVLALLSSPLRRTSDLVVPNTLTSSAPVGLVWLLIFLVAFAMSLFFVAAVHGPWWLTALGLLVIVLLMGTWSLSTTVVSGRWLLLAAGLTQLVAVLVLGILRARHRFAWWEVPVALALIGGAMVVGLAAIAGGSRDLGIEANPVYLQTLDTMGYLVLPAALAAGVAVAEIAVGVTVVATQQAQRLSHHAWPYVLLAVVVAVRVVQTAWQVLTLDPVSEGWLAVGPALAIAAGFGLVGWGLVRLARRHPVPGRVMVSALPGEVNRIGLPVGAVLLGLQLPVLVLLSVVQLVISLSPGGRAGDLTLDVLPVADRVVDILRMVLAVVLLLVSVRLARLGRLTLALMVGCTSVMLFALVMRLLTGYRWAVWIDVDVLNLVATAVVVVAGLWYLVRGRLSRPRAVALAGGLILSALFSYRDFVSDPVGALLGYSGVALVLFGLVWDFSTGSAWANGDSRRYPRPVRVLLILGYTLLTATILAYGSLVRSSTRYANLSDFAELGDLILGTALLAAAFISVLATLPREQPVR